MLKNPLVRVGVRAFIAGASVFVATFQAHQVWDASLLKGAIGAGILASLEYFTKLNPTVGK